MKRYVHTSLFIVIFLLSGTFLRAQDFLISDAGFPPNNPMDCNTYSDAQTPNFYDQGGASGNYTPNFSDTITLCPDLNLGTKVTLKFAINAGFEFNVDASDSIYVFDGPDANSPLLGVHNSATDPNGFNYTASWNNPSGCLTVVFHTDGANEGTGWLANVTCGNPFQPFDMHMEAFVNGNGPNKLNPADTGYVDLCFGDSILFVAKPLFPNAQEATGNGYSQNVNNVDYEWHFSSGGTYPNNDSIWFTPPAREGYFVSLKVTDQFPLSQLMTAKVRVSTLPSFFGTGPEEDTVCLGENTNLIGGVTQSDTVGVDIPEGSFSLGGAFAGLTYLPDGSGAQYQAPVNITGFPDTAVILNPEDLNMVCITMEHSYLGDLEIALECPNGTQVSLVNSFSPGFIPGGFGGGGTFLGDADDASGDGNPGIGWEYCFSSVYNDWGTMGAELAAGNTVPTTVTPGNQSMNPNGVYLPDQSFADFAGCPINGDWTIIVQDNLGIDDGYIFEWGLYFDPSLLPGIENYQNTVSSEEWFDDPTIISGEDDTVLVVQPNTPGNHSYTYQITDNFGCVYDTTVSLYVLPQPTIFGDTLACNQVFQSVGVNSYAGGVWTASDTSVHFSPNTTTDNPLIATSTSTGGTYTVTYTDNACGTSVSAEIFYPSYLYTQINDTVICENDDFTLFALEHPAALSYLWNTGATGTSIDITEPGQYIVTIENQCYTYSDTANVGSKICDIEAPNVIVLSSQAGNNIWYVQSDGIADFHCTIVNRWGNLVYEFDDVKGYWDGRDQNGNFVDDGVYFYTIRAKAYGGNEVNKQGMITVRQ